MNVCSVQSFMVIHPMVFERFESGPKWWTEGQINIAVPGATLLARRKRLKNTVLTLTPVTRDFTKTLLH